MSMPPGWSNEVALSDAVLNPSSYRGGIFSIGGVNSLMFGLENEINHLRAYNNCPPLKSIVSRRAKFFNVGKIDVYNLNTGKTAPNGLEAQAYRKVLKRPNPLQTQKQFFAQHNTYLDIFGYCPVFLIRPFGMNDQITQMWNIPPWLFNINFTGNWLQQTTVEGIFKGYTLNWTTGQVILPTENLKLIFDDGFGTDMDINLCIPDSRLRSLEFPVSNIIAALKARNTLITRRGPTGILSNGAKDTVGNIPLPEGEKKAVQRDFSRYGIVGQEFQVIITEANLSWQQMGSSTKELMLFEEVEEDINHLCDAYGWFPELMGRTKSATFDNKEKAEKMAYTGTIIPESESRLEQLSNAIMGVGNNLCYLADFSHAHALQQEVLNTSRARKELDTALEKEFKNNIITLNTWREAVELDLETEIDEPSGKAYGDMKYWELVQMGWQFGSDLASIDQSQSPPKAETTAA